MVKSRNALAWTEEGYSLFAREGIAGIQVERLARILGRNKSGFYHYFGDMEGYYADMLALHQQKAFLFLEDLGRVQTIDPDYLNVIAKHKVTVLFQIQLIRTKKPMFCRVAEDLDRREGEVLQEVWMEYLGFHDHPDLAVRYFNIVRDMFYARMGFHQMSYAYLQSLMNDAKMLMRQLLAQAPVADELDCAHI